MNVMLPKRPQSRLWEILERGLLREIGYSGIIVSLVLFVSAMALLGANVSELRRSYARVQHSNEAILQLTLLANDILRIEMIVRGYALSGDRAYYGWLSSTRSTEHRRLATFDRLFNGDPVQRENLKKLRLLLDVHDRGFDRLMAMLPDNKAAVTAEIVDYSKRGKRWPLEGLLVAMRTTELQIVADQQKHAEQQVTQAYHSAIGISALALILGALGFAFVVHDRKLQLKRQV